MSCIVGAHHQKTKEHLRHVGRSFTHSRNRPHLHLTCHEPAGPDFIDLSDLFPENVYGYAS